MDINKMKKDELKTLVMELAAKVNQQSKMIERFKDYDLERNNQMRSMQLDISNLTLDVERYKNAYNTQSTELSNADKEFIRKQVTSEVSSNYIKTLMAKNRLIKDCNRQIQDLQSTCKQYRNEVDRLRTKNNLTTSTKEKLTHIKKVLIQFLEDYELDMSTEAYMQLTVHIEDFETILNDHAEN